MENNENLSQQPAAQQQPVAPQQPTAQPQPVQAQPAQAQPAQPQPVQAQPAQAQPAQPQPAQAQPTQPQQPGTDYTQQQYAQQQAYQQYAYQQQQYAQQGYQQPYNYQQQYTYQQINSPKNKLATGLFAILFGSLGIHKFYLGYTSTGVIMLLITILGSIISFGLAAIVMSIIGVIEGILYLTKSDYDFYQTYVANQKHWF